MGQGAQGRSWFRWGGGLLVLEMLLIPLVVVSRSHTSAPV